MSGKSGYTKKGFKGRAFDGDFYPGRLGHFHIFKPVLNADIIFEIL